MAQAGDFRGGVFISYRRELDEKAGHAAKLAGLLRARLGTNRVFLDDCSIRSGDDIEEEIIRALHAAHAVVFVVSPGWIDKIIRRGAGLQKFERSEIDAESDEINDWVLCEAEIVANRRYQSKSPPDVH